MFKLKEKQTQNQSLGTIKYIVISIQICLNVNFMEENSTLTVYEFLTVKAL